MRILVDQTFWLSLLDPEDEHYLQAQEKFTDILSENNMIYITNFIYNETLSLIRSRIPHKEEKFISIFENALNNGYLKMVYIGRMTQRELNKLWKKHSSWPYHPFDLANIIVVRKRFLQGLLTWRPEYKNLNFNVLNL